MKQFKPFFFILALLAVSAMGGVGIFIAERNVLGVIACLVTIVGVMGYGFATKARYRREGKL